MGPMGYAHGDCSKRVIAMRRLVLVLSATAFAAACTSTGAGSGSSGGDTTCDGGGGASFGPLDPGFSNTPPGAWTTTGGATIEAWVPAGVDPGVARFDIAKVSSLAFVLQTFAMPAYSLTQQFALETTGIGSGVHARVDNMTLGELVLGSTTSKSRLCLGERAFGHDITLAFGTTGTSVGGLTSTVDLDHVSILAAPDCPAAGAFADGDFEAGNGWTFEAPSGIVTSGGPTSGRAGHLVVPDSRREAGLKHGPVSFPWKTLARPALRVVARGGELPIGIRLTSELGSSAPPLGFVRPTSTPAPTVVCIPEWTKGLALPFLFEVRQTANLRNIEYFIDDVAFVSDPSCPESSFVLGGDFETANATAYWAFSDSTKGSGGPPPAQISGIVTTGGAHSGASHALLSVAGECNAATMSQTVTTPISQPGRGPAVKLWYKTSGLSQVRIEVAAGETGAQLPAAPDWTARTVCLDPYSGNRPTSLSVYASGPKPGEGSGGGGGVGCHAIAVETVAFDDVEVTTDPSCPTN